MLAVPTPGRLAQRAEFYHQLAQLTDAGLTLRSALESQQSNPPARWLREPATRLLGHIKEGGTFSEAVAASRKWVPTFDAALLDAGEQSGQLPSCFKLLASHYSERARLTRDVLSNLAYPVLLFHFAVMIGPLPQLVLTGNLSGYLRIVGTILVPVYAVVALLFWSAGSKHGERWRGIMESIANLIPLFGSARRNLALSRLALSLHALLNAGVPVVRAWLLAAAASGSVRLKREVASWPPLIEAGVTPAQLLAESGVFPELFSTMYNTGEISGTIDDSLVRLQRLHQERGTMQFRIIAEWLPKIVYFAIVIYVAYSVVSFYVGYYGQIGDIIEQ
jgi:type II secretory pathway component PulF